MIDTTDGRWYAYLFQDHGAVGRIPYLVPMKWNHGWPVLGLDGKVPMELNLPASKGLIPGIVDSDEFERTKDERALPLVWQWNHNPDNEHWSLTERPGYLRDRPTQHCESQVVQTVVQPQARCATDGPGRKRRTRPGPRRHGQAQQPASQRDAARTRENPQGKNPKQNRSDSSVLLGHNAWS